MRSLLRTLPFLVAVLGIGAPPLEAQDRDSPGRWSISTSLTFPIVRIYQVYLSYRIDDRNEVSIGPAFQNYRHESFTANAYTLIVGYRRYLTDRVSVEASSGGSARLMDPEFRTLSTPARAR